MLYMSEKFHNSLYNLELLKSKDNDPAHTHTVIYIIEIGSHPR